MTTDDALDEAAGTVTIEMRLHARTFGQVLVSDDGERANAVWLPRASVQIKRRMGSSTYDVTMPEWLAIDRGLV